MGSMISFKHFIELTLCGWLRLFSIG